MESNNTPPLTTIGFKGTPQLKIRLLDKTAAIANIAEKLFSLDYETVIEFEEAFMKNFEKADGDKP